MKIIDVKKLELDGTGKETIKFNNNAAGDTVCSELYLLSDNDISLTVKGYVGDDSVEVKTIDMANYAIIDSITSAGLYMVPVGSFNRVDIEYDGTADVIVKELY